MAARVNLTFLLFGPLLLASFVLCGREGKKWWSLDTPLRGYESATRRELAKFLRARNVVPEPELAPVAVEWAEDVINRHWRWDHCLVWAGWCGLPWALWQQSHSRRSAMSRSSSLCSTSCSSLPSRTVALYDGRTVY